ncbi:glutamate--cysteine ligase [bacterium TMED277]|nr:MAG: glutamate--cysteine ligase [bacterium TMED277]
MIDSENIYILDKNQLKKYFEDGSKPKEKWGIGAEYENFIFSKNTLKPINYSGSISILTLFENLIDRFGWTPIKENNLIIGLRKGDSNISLEPGGQFELSGGIKKSVHDVEKELKSFMREMKILTTEFNLGLFSLGTTPVWKLTEIPLMPKDRYQKIMAPYMKKVGKYGLDMMFRTCTIQVNLDYSSEDDMAKKLKVGFLLQPLATALFASSPFFENRDTGYESWRANIWKHTDAARTGIPKFIFNNGLCFSDWVEFALDVPMYFIKRDEKYVNLAGESFRDFLSGNLKSMPGEKPFYSDWVNHLTTIFTDVRLKNFIEMRGADGGPSYNVTALAAFWTGLMYDNEALDNIFNLSKSWTWEEVSFLNEEVCKFGLDAKFRGKALWGLAADVLNISALGLRNRKFLENSYDESIFLSPIEEMIKKKVSLPNNLRARFNNKGSNRIDSIFENFNFYQGFQR